MFEDDIFGARRRALEDWDEAMYRSQQLAGMIHDAECPHCHMQVGACVIESEPGEPREVECPACRERWVEDE